MLIISHKSSADFKKFLHTNNFSYIETIDNPKLDPRIADHPDLSIFALGKQSLVIDKNVSSYYKDHIKSLKIIDGDEVNADYPNDSIYNVYQSSNFYIHNDMTEPHIENYMKGKDYNHLFVKQGYTRCSIVPMGDKILTTDYGIYKSLKDKIQVVLLKEEKISLDGFDNGFLGGTCGFFDDILLFNGNIEHLNSFEIIKKEAEISGIKLLYPNCDLIDTGSILPISK